MQGDELIVELPGKLAFLEFRRADAEVAIGEPHEEGGVQSADATSPIHLHFVRLKEVAVTTVWTVEPFEVTNQAGFRKGFL